MLQRGAQGGGEAGMMGLCPRLHLLLAAATKGMAITGSRCVPANVGPPSGAGEGFPTPTFEGRRADPQTLPARRTLLAQLFGVV